MMTGATHRGAHGGGGGGPDAPRDHEHLVLQLERELGITVRKLEQQRAQQREEMETLNRDLVRVCQERQELRAKLDLAQERSDGLRSDLDDHLRAWGEERRSLEQRLAAAEASRDSARSSERQLMEQTAVLEARIAGAHAQSKSAHEKHRLNEELERRLASQTGQIDQLRAKLEDLTGQLAEAANNRRTLEEEQSRLLRENEDLAARARGLQARLDAAEEASRDLHHARERASAAEDGLASARRVSATLESQVATLQEGLQAERAKFRKLEESHRERVANLDKQLEQARARAVETERVRVEQAASYQEELRAQRSHTERLNAQLASLELNFAKDAVPSRALASLELNAVQDRPQSPARSAPRAAPPAPALMPSPGTEPHRLDQAPPGDSSAAGGSSGEEFAGYNRVVEKALNSGPRPFEIPDPFDVLGQSLYGDPNNSMVSDYISRVLGLGPQPTAGPSASTSSPLQEQTNQARRGRAKPKPRSKPRGTPSPKAARRPQKITIPSRATLEPPAGTRRKAPTSRQGSHAVRKRKTGASKRPQRRPDPRPGTADADAGGAGARWKL